MVQSHRLKRAFGRPLPFDCVSVVELVSLVLRLVWNAVDDEEREAHCHFHFAVEMEARLIEFGEDCTVFVVLRRILGSALTEHVVRMKHWSLP